MAGLKNASAVPTLHSQVDRRTALTGAYNACWQGELFPPARPVSGGFPLDIGYVDISDQRSWRFVMQMGKRVGIGHKAMKSET